MASAQLNTIGYEGAALDDFIATLARAGVDYLIDIRDRAQSRRKGFSKTALADRLQSAGIMYLHLRQLGDPKPGREAARAGDWRRFRDIYDQVIESDEAQSALGQIEDQLKTGRTIALLCYERDQTTCHRKIVSDILEARTGLKARHLGVQTIEPDTRAHRRVLHPGEGATASV
ncbi:MAG: DUF488 family protein [Alphaproteobacteria bacterium]|nr:DUF488 family protein [Alphaproteobacteria bacterium]